MNFIFRKPWYYVFFGAIYFSFWLLFKFGGLNELPKAILSTLIDVGVTMAGLIFTVEILLPRFVYTRKYGIFALSFFLLVIVGGSIIIVSQMILLDQSIIKYQEKIAQNQKHYYYWFWADLIFASYFMVFFASSVGAGIRLAFDRAKESNKAQKLEAEKATAELELLKEQINPHFLFNALNTIYYKIDRTNTEGRETLQRFSNMLRYQLYECDKPAVDIENELAFIKSYIELQKERLGKNYTVAYDGFDALKGFSLSPFLVLPLVENCFKHLSDHAIEKNMVSIRCSKTGNVFEFETLNSVTEQPARNGNGIGLENIRKRLQLLYPGRHELNTRANGNTYGVTLKLTVA